MGAGIIIVQGHFAEMIGQVYLLLLVFDSCAIIRLNDFYTCIYKTECVVLFTVGTLCTELKEIFFVHFSFVSSLYVLRHCVQRLSTYSET